MSRTNVEKQVNSERRNLLNGKTGIDDAVVTFGNRGQTVATGLLALGDVGESKEWFHALVDEWLTTADNRFNAKYKNKAPQSAQLGPWEEYTNALYCAILAQHRLTDTAKKVQSRAGEKFINELENRKLAHRIDLIRALSSLLIGDESVEHHLEHLERCVRNRNKPWATARYLSFVQSIRGLTTQSESTVKRGINDLLEFHEDHIVQAPDSDAVQRAVAIDATAMLALARWEGMNLTIEHDAIPDALNDDDHYPVGE